MNKPNDTYIFVPTDNSVYYIYTSSNKKMTVNTRTMDKRMLKKDTKLYDNNDNYVGTWENVWETDNKYNPTAANRRGGRRSRRRKTIKKKSKRKHSSKNRQ